MKTIDDVRSFWDANPLLTGEIEAEVGTREWFQEFDAIKKSVFLNDLSKFIGPNLVANKKVLDIGCGPGFWNRQLSNSNCDYYGIDISKNSVELALASQKIFHCPGSLRVGNAEQLEFDDNSFDHIVSEGVIHHTPDTNKCVQEIYRVLRKGGTCSISLYYTNFILRHTSIFNLCTALSHLVGVGLKGRGRSTMMRAKSPQEFVRIYDGAENPIGKSYTKDEVLSMFSSFKDLKLSLYYFPSRAFPFKLPDFFWRWMANNLGLMILIEAKK